MIRGPEDPACGGLRGEVRLQAGHGEIVAVAGGNGAGKSTRTGAGLGRPIARGAVRGILERVEEPEEQRDG